MHVTANDDESQKIVLIGGSGRLGKELFCTRPSMISPTKSELNIINYYNSWDYLKVIKPKIVILSAALVGKKECEINPDLARKTNIAGAKNIAQICEKLKAKLIYISTCAVFDGRKGNYSENDSTNPQYFYAETKYQAETIISRIIDDYLIIRTDFFSDKLKYYSVFVDHFCSKEHTSIIAKKINLLLGINWKGIIHLGGFRESLYNILKPFFPAIFPIKINESNMPDFPRDLSLSTEMYLSLETQFKHSLAKCDIIRS